MSSILVSVTVNLLSLFWWFLFLSSFFSLTFLLFSPLPLSLVSCPFIPYSCICSVVMYINLPSHTNPHTHRYPLIMLWWTWEVILCGLRHWVISEMYMCVFHAVNDDHVCTVCNKATSHIHHCGPHWAERESVGGVCMLCFVFDVRNTYSTHKQLKTEHIVPLGHRGGWKRTFLFL